MKGFKFFFKLINAFDRQEKKSAILLVILIIGGAIAETFGIGVILPFMNIILNPDLISKYPPLEYIYNLQWVRNYSNFVIYMCIGLVVVYIFKSLYMFLLIYVQSKFVLKCQVNISEKLFSSYLYKPYSFYFNRNSAELQRNINVSVPNVINGVLLPGLSFFTEFLIVFAILTVLLIVDPISAIFAILLLGGVSITFYLRLKKNIDKAAREQNIFGIEMVKTVTEGIGSIKEIKVLGREDSFISQYNRSSIGYAKTNAFYTLWNQVPRLLIEFLAITGMIIIVVANIVMGKNITSILPILALFGMAAIRIMPSLNRILGYITSLRYYGTFLDYFYEDLMASKSMEQVKTTNSQIGNKLFTKELELSGVTYKYPQSEKRILNNISIKILKGQTIGIIGPSGAGKTTLVDLILGLLSPTSGKLLVDGLDIQDNIYTWRNCVGYVPQSIFLTDNTIAQNVAFGLPYEKVDEKRIWEVLDAAHMRKFVEELPEGIHTNVGENGVKLSGGQRQRIGIARALYSDPEMLIMDEATSSLDSEVEQLITEAITSIGRSKTMIIIAHRLNTLEHCDKIYKVENGVII